MDPSQKPLPDEISNINQRLAQVADALQSLSEPPLANGTGQHDVASAIQQAKQAVDEARLALASIRATPKAVKRRNKPKNATSPDMEQPGASLHPDVEQGYRRLSAVMEALPTGVAILDAKGGNIQTNQAFELVWGNPRPRVDDVSGYSAYKAWWVDSGQPVKPEEWASAQAVQEGKTVTGQLLKIQRFDGTFGYVLNSAAPIIDALGKVTGCAVTIQDISELRHREEQVEQLNHTLKALSNSNQAMIHATDESEFLQDVCRIIIQDCGFAMVWIGYVQDDERKSVKPVASAGFERGYLDALNISLNDPERSRGPTGMAIRTRKPARCNNMLTDPAFAPWRQAALNQGYASSIVLPLISGDQAIGAINIYSPQPEAFSDDEEKLLVELAGDLSFGIAALRLRAESARSTAALARSEAHYRSLFENMTEGFALHEIVCDDQGTACDYRFLEINPSFERLTGLKRETAVGRLASEVLPGLDPFWIDAYGKVALTGAPVLLENYTAAPDRFYRVYAYRPLPGQFAAIFLDITDSKRMEAELRQSEVTLRTVLDQMPAGVTVRDAQSGGLILANRQSRQIMGVLAENAAQFSFYRGKHPDGRPYTPEEWPVNRSMSTGEVIHAEEIDYERGDGSPVTLSVNSAPIRDSDGKIRIGVVIFQDVTDQILTRERLAYLASFPENNPRPVVEASLDGQVTYANPAAQLLFPDLLELGKAHPWLFEWEPVVDQLRKDTGKMVSRDIAIGERYFQQSLNYLADKGLVRLYGVDVTERRRAEHALNQARNELELRVQERTHDLNTANVQLRAEVTERQEAQANLETSLEELQVVEEELRNNNEMMIDAQRVLDGERQRYHDLFDYAPDAYLVTDKNGVVQDANQSATTLLAISQRGLIGKPLIVFISKADRKPFEHLLTTLNKKNVIQSQELKLIPRHGDEIWASAKVTLAQEQDKESSLRWVIRDITLRKQAEDIIRQNAIRNSVLSEVSQFLAETSMGEKALLDVVAKTTARLVGDGCIITLVSADGNWLEPMAVNHKKPEVLEMMSSLYGGSHNPITAGLFGRVFQSAKPLLVEDLTPADAATSIPSQYQQYQDAVGISSLLVVPIRIGDKAIGTFGLLRDRGSRPYTQDDQSMLEILASRTGQAIHNARLYQELQAALQKELETHDQLVQAEKFAAVGRLLASITHEINNPLQTIKNCLYLCQLDISPGTPAYESLGIAATETNRLSNLVAQLREIYRPPTRGLSKPVNLPTLVDEVQVLLVSYLQDKHVRWEVTPPASEFSQMTVDGVADQLKQVFLNIGLNAIDAMEPTGGSLNIDFRINPAAGQVGVCFRDTGPGLPDEIKGKLFEPFITTKEKGLGLGLVICYDIIQKHKGHIDVESEAGQGATFTIWLPARRV